MNFFKNQKQEPEEILVDEFARPIDPPVNYNSVVDYLVGLSDEDYKKVCEIVPIYREANAKTAAVLEIENEPTSAIYAPEEPEAPEPATGTMLDEDDDLSLAFLEDEPAPQKVEVRVNKK